MPEYPPDPLVIAIILAGVGLWLMQPQLGRAARVSGALLGAAMLAGAWAWAAYAQRGYGIVMEAGALPFYYVFSAIAIGSAAFVIAARKPVYAALWFVMVVLASAGLFLTLAAEFMAFAMVIIYAGAILVTYMFVIMLAAYSGDPQREEDLPLYDRTWRNPAGAIFCGVILLAVLTPVAFEGRQADLSPTAIETDQQIIGTILTQRSSRRLAERIDPALEPGELGRLDALTGGTSEALSNTERVGLDLFRGHPLGLELAGVILLVALVGAVVIARTRVPEESSAGGPGGAAHG